MFEVAGSHLCLVDGALGGHALLKVLHQPPVNFQDLFNVAEEGVDVAGGESALMRISLLLSGLLKNVLLCACIL